MSNQCFHVLLQLPAQSSHRITSLVQASDSHQGNGIVADGPVHTDLRHGFTILLSQLLDASSKISELIHLQTWKWHEMAMAAGETVSARALVRKIVVFLERVGLPVSSCFPIGNDHCWMIWGSTMFSSCSNNCSRAPRSQDVTKLSPFAIKQSVKNSPKRNPAKCQISPQISQPSQPSQLSQPVILANLIFANFSFVKLSVNIPCPTVPKATIFTSSS